jgi:hypothetical protein
MRKSIPASGRAEACDKRRILKEESDFVAEKNHHKNKFSD